MSEKEVYKRCINGLSFELYRMDNEQFLSKTVNRDIDLIVTSPPYNIGSKCPKTLTNRKNGGCDAKSYGSVEDYADSLPEDKYQEQQIKILNLCGNALSIDGGIFYNHKIRRKSNSIIDPSFWINKTRLKQIDRLIWYRKSTHENGRTHPRQTDEVLYILTRHGNRMYYAPKYDKSLGNIKTVWDDIPRQTENLYNAAYSIDLAERAIKYYSKPKSLVCDIYSGSGTTMVASYRMNRNFIGCEINKKAFDIAKKRFEKELSNKIR